MHGRLQLLVEYLKEQVGVDFDRYIQDFVAHGDVALALQKKHKMTMEEVAILCISADLTHQQFDTLCKKGVLLDNSRKSSRDLTEGMGCVEKSLPEAYFLCEGHPGVCFTPKEYVHRALDIDYDKLEIPESEPNIYLMRAGDGTDDAKYPMFNEAFNFVQDPDCQCIDRCHIVCLGRITESVAAEAQHLSTFHEAWQEIPPYRGKNIEQGYGGDGADKVKKEGHGGFSADHWCPDCFVNKACKHRLSWRHPEIKAHP